MSVKLTVQLPDDLYEALKEKASSYERTPTQEARYAIRKWLSPVEVVPNWGLTWGSEKISFPPAKKAEAKKP